MRIPRENLDKKMKKDLETLEINEEQVLTVRYVTVKFRRLAKYYHPDKSTGSTKMFQELLNAYGRVLSSLKMKKVRIRKMTMKKNHLTNLKPLMKGNTS